MLLFLPEISVHILRKFGKIIPDKYNYLNCSVFSLDGPGLCPSEVIKKSRVADPDPVGSGMFCPDPDSDPELSFRIRIRPI